EARPPWRRTKGYQRTAGVPCVPLLSRALWAQPSQWAELARLTPRIARPGGVIERTGGNGRLLASPKLGFFLLILIPPRQVPAQTFRKESPDRERARRPFRWQDEALSAT